MKETKFKQTEVGMIPSDWDVIKIGDVLQIKHGYAFKGEYFSNNDNGKIVVTPGNFRLDGGFQYQQNPIYYRGEYPKEFELNGGDLVVTMTDLSKNSDTLGNPLLIPMDGKRYLHNQRIGLACFFNDYLLKDFVFRMMCSKNYHQRIVLTAAGSTVKHTSPRRICDVSIPHPHSKDEQQRIANALSDVDALIANLEKLIAKKKNIKQGAMQQLLTGKKRLPGFGSDERRKECHSERSAKREVEESSGYKMTELGLIPNDWEVKTFGELFDMCTANIPIKDVNQEFYVGTENMLQNKMGVVKNTAVLPYSKVREYQKNDILVSNIRPYLKKIWFADKNGGCSTDVLVFRVKDKNQSPSFLYNVVADDRFFNIVNENAIGTKMPRGDKNVIKQILFAVPSSKAEQTAIANVLSDMDAEISALETKLAKYRTLKTGMMQQLLTGKIRLVK